MINILKIEMISIFKNPLSLPLPAFGREKIPEGGITPLWQSR